MRLLLTNDDGVFAPGLAALEQQLRHLGEVIVVAPSTEQSGVGHTDHIPDPADLQIRSTAMVNIGHGRLMAHRPIASSFR